jgi:hypothetical protein
MKRPQAVFTIVKNESFFLPIWLKYYSTYFRADDIYVLDNGTTDGSTTRIQAQVIQRPSGFDFDVHFLRDTVQAFQAELLASYQVVVFAEADEIIVPARPGEFARHVDAHPTVSCNGFEVVHNHPLEPSIDWVRPLLRQRAIWVPRPDFCKPLVSRVPLQWEFGFHSCEPFAPWDPTLTLVHLRRIDYDHSKNRLVQRCTWPRKPGHQPNHAWQWSLPDEEKFNAWFREDLSQARLIDERVKDVC